MHQSHHRQRLSSVAEEPNGRRRHLSSAHPSIMLPHTPPPGYEESQGAARADSHINEEMQQERLGFPKIAQIFLDL